MAMSFVPNIAVRRLARFGLTTADADRLATFYERMFGFRRIAADRVCGMHFEKMMEVDGGAKRVMLVLGDEVLELLEFDSPGAAYPLDAGSSDLIFQHFAIVTANMDQAFERLLNSREWSAISRGGPQKLPESSGGVTAFKFRDPDGHPLELLAFPDGNAPSRWKACSTDLCLGIDHSAICVSDSAFSKTFYEGLGLRVSARSLNHGPEQARLDGLRDPCVEVTALSPIGRTPHVELLCYRPEILRPGVVRNNDVAATRLAFEIDPLRSEEPVPILLREILDPDGHRLLMLPPATDLHLFKVA
jgi:catechol 2,3-dioxygenase-like lactoylglutathione lyase family enzyme